MRHGGFDDWAIPARDQLEVLYRNLKPTMKKNYCWFLDGYNAHGIEHGERYTPDTPTQTVVEAYRDGQPDAFAPEWYWSSTQCSAHYAFSQYFYGGTQSYYGKYGKLRARAVRMIQLSN